MSLAIEPWHTWCYNWCMGLWSSLRQLTEAKKADPTVHDYTFVFTGHEVSLVKSLSDNRRAFLVGHGPGIKPDDHLVVRVDRKNIKYVVEQVRYAGESWSAYGTVLHVVSQRPRMNGAARPHQNTRRMK